MILSGCRNNTEVTPLSVYIVSQEKLKGGRFIDTPDFPKLGYIAPKPDLAITRLEEVNFLAITEELGTNVPAHIGQPRPGVIIVLRDEDARKFAALSEKASMKKTLLMLGDTPLLAPMVTSPLDAVKMQRLQFTFPAQADRTKIENDFRKLTK